MSNFSNDEATALDNLERKDFAKIFANLAVNCETPFVVGLYGTWGTGKTTLMKLIKNKINPSKCFCVWFDTWQYQSEERIELALLQIIYDECKAKIKENKAETPNNLQDLQGLKTHLIKIGKALASTVSFNSGVSNLVSISVKPDKFFEALEDYGERYEENKFNKRSESILLRQEFEKFIKKAIKQLEVERLVIFIDDLDRCSSANAVKIIESLKLFLNIENCVYFLGVDKKILEQQIQDEKIAISEENEYLDKIVQLEFFIPLIQKSLINKYMSSLLPEDLEKCTELLVNGLGDNPRKVKRFINSLILYDQLLSKQKQHENYNSRILTIILLIQDLAPKLHKTLANNTKPIQDLIENKVKTIANLSVPVKLLKVFDILDSSELPKTEDEYETYFFYTSIAKAEEASQTKVADSSKGKEKLNSILEKHAIWLNTDGEDGERADLSGFRLSEFDFSGKRLQGVNFEKSWFNNSILTDSDLTNFDNDKKTNFSQVDFAYSDLRSADLSFVGAHFSNFFQVNAEGAIFAGAGLYAASFKEAILKNTDFKGANLEYANFEGADISYADLQEVKNMTGGTIYRADNIQTAKFDKNFWRTALNNEEDIEHENIVKKLREIKDKGVDLKKPPFFFEDSDIEFLNDFFSLLLTAEADGANSKAE